MAAFTKRAIVEAFICLLNEHPLDKITVKNIIDMCGVNRSTFYYYFEDIYDLINTVFEYETKKIVDNHIDYDSWVDGVKEAMSFAMDNKKAIYHVYKSVSRERLERYLNEVFDWILMDAASSQAEETGASEEDIRLVADVYKYTLIGLIFKWLEEGMKAEPDEVINKLGYLLEGNMHKMLLRAGEYGKQTTFS